MREDVVTPKLGVSPLFFRKLSFNGTSHSVWQRKSQRRESPEKRPAKVQRIEEASLDLFHLSSNVSEGSLGTCLHVLFPFLFQLTTTPVDGQAKEMEGEDEASLENPEGDRTFLG